MVFTMFSFSKNTKRNHTPPTHQRTPQRDCRLGWLPPQSTLRHLINTQVDYITLGPFRAIHTEGEVNTTLGLKGYTAIVEALNTKTPIIGRGSITTKDISEILNTGISGVAVADEITQNFDIVKTFNQLLSASSTEEKRHTF